MNKFSVLMSVYFKEKPQYFDLALESNLCLQTLKPNDFVLVCDGPLTEELDAVIKKYEEKYPEILNVCRLEKNGGLGNALNYGLSKCKYDLVARSDSDDVCESCRFEKQIGFMEKHNDIAVCGSNIDEFNEEPSSPIRCKEMPEDNAGILEMAKFRNPINHMTVVFRKSVIEKVGSYMHLKFLEDYYLWLRVLAAGYRASNINEILVHARVGNGMVQRRSNTSIKGWIFLSNFKLKNKMINYFEHLRNIVSIIAFVYMPNGFKEFLYKKVLRKA